jgi:RHH-type rel operon transcriptional repressor/antitoxin RelB
MTISLRISDDDAKLFKAYAALHNISISELVRQSVLERIEDEYDLIAYENALKEYQENSTTYSHEEVCRMLELD